MTIQGDGIYINGVRRNFWNWVGVRGNPQNGEEWLKAFRADNDRFTRFSQNRKTSRFLKTREERLDFYDRHGIPGRLCSMIDGMFINRTLGFRTTDPVTGKGWLDPNWQVWEGFARHMDQLTRAYRNHPSVIMYQVENELIYINGMNIYGAYLDRICDLMDNVVEVARSNDPTRPYTVGGAGDLLRAAGDQLPALPRRIARLVSGERLRARPSSPPSTRTTGPGCARSRGSSARAPSRSALEYGSYVIGDAAFRSADDELRGKAAYLRMLYGGYRWAGVAGFFPWDNLHGYADADKVFSDLYIVPRRQTSRLYAGKDNTILFKVMNDTLSGEPVHVDWTYEAGGKTVTKGAADMHIQPGFGEERPIAIRAPQTDVRLDGTLTLKATQPGAPDYVDVRSVPVLPVVSTLTADVPVTVLDRSGKLADFLTKTGLKFDRIEKLDDVKGRQGLLLVGPDTLNAQEALGRDLLTFAAQGGRVVVLEQDVPAAGANLPAPVRTTTHFGGYAHPKALGTPVFKDLGTDDLIDWAGGGPVYKNVYEKPTQGARSLAECGPLLPYAPLIEMPAGEGVIVLCQLTRRRQPGRGPGGRRAAAQPGNGLRRLQAGRAASRPSARRATSCWPTRSTRPAA